VILISIRNWVRAKQKNVCTNTAYIQKQLINKNKFYSNILQVLAISLSSYSLRPHPSSKSRVNGLMSGRRLEMSTVTNGPLGRYCSVSSSTAHTRRQNVYSVDFQMMQNWEVWLPSWWVELQFRSTIRHWKPRQKKPFWGFCSRNIHKCKILHLGRKNPIHQYRQGRNLLFFRPAENYLEAAVAAELNMN